MTTNYSSAGGKARAITQRLQAEQAYYAAPNYCRYCRAMICTEPGVKIQRTRRKTFCNHSCANLFYTKPAPPPKPPRDSSIESVGRITKGALVARRGGYQSWRSTIRSHACKVFAASGRPMACTACGYKHHVQIAHVKGVATFQADTTIAEINALTNLVALCPNHHWEFDHGLLRLE